MSLKEQPLKSWIPGTVTEVKIKPNDLVKMGDVVCVVETGSGKLDVPSLHSGQVKDVMVSKGTRLGMGAIMANLRRD